MFYNNDIFKNNKAKSTVNLSEVSCQFKDTQRLKHMLRQLKTSLSLTKSQLTMLSSESSKVQVSSRIHLIVPLPSYLYENMSNTQLTSLQNCLFSKWVYSQHKQIVLLTECLLFL